MAAKTLADVGPGLYHVAHSRWGGVLIALVEGEAPFLELTVFTLLQGQWLECGDDYRAEGADLAPAGFSVLSQLADAQAIAAANVPEGSRVILHG